MESIAVRLLGRFEARIRGEVVKQLEATKVRELLSYLLINRNRPHSREALATTLWSESPPSHSRKYLRQVIWQLQTAMGSQPLATIPPLTVNPQWVHLQVGNDFWLDVARFEDAVSSTKGVTGERLTQEQVTRLREAVLLYAGDLLEGCYQEWCLFERERLQNLYLVALDKLVSYCEVKQLFEEGLSYGTTILRYDRARERTHWQMMRLHYLAGDRTGALRQYERCVQALHQELGVEPSRQTNALYEHIRDDRLRSNDPGPVYFDTGENKPIEGQILGHLKRLAGIMVESQRQAHEELATLETVLGLGTRLQTPEVRRQSRTTTRPS